MSTLPITTVVNVSISQPPKGLGFYNVNTIAIFTDEEPIDQSTMGVDGYLVSRSARTIETAFGTDTEVTKAAKAIFSQSPNILAGDGVVLVCPLETDETLSEALARLTAKAYYCAAITTKAIDDTEFLAAAVTNQSQQTSILFATRSVSSALTASTGLFAKINDQSLSRTKCLYYATGSDDTEKADNARLFSYSYAGRAFTTNFAGSNTSSTMHLKDLAGLGADTSIDETIEARCKAIGVDIYPSIAGLAKVESFANGLFFDQVYQQIWLLLSIQVNVFNALATTRTKIPQTEIGMNILKGACKQICQLGVTIGYLAPGTWNSSDTFGNLDDFKRNVSDNGYYIYSMPVSQQLQADREERKSPLVQIACKEAGAIHSANILISIEA